jgi:hypothetical protein
MSSRKAKLLSLIALAGAVALMSASAQAQDVWRPYRYHHAYNAHAQAIYDAQAYMVGGVNVLPPTIVSGFIASSFDPYGMLPSVYGCCATAINEHHGLIGNGVER